jgi:3-methyl-2-oxobutanoate hydroxymethyltransferase
MKTIQDFAMKKESGEKISMVTCYDSWSAKIIAETAIDCVLVGDSLAMVIHGFPTTLNASLRMMALHTAAVVRSLSNKFVIADMPFLSYRKDLASNVAAAGILMKAGAQAVKLEGAKGNLQLIEHLVDSGIPVMGHLGLTPQSVHQLGGFKVQAKNRYQQITLKKQAKDLENAGCFSLVLECVPATLAKEVTESLDIPTIGIGAGIDCDGQVLVLQDMLGMAKDFSPKFLKKYMDGFNLIRDALNTYHAEVGKGQFPTNKESY